MKSVFPIALVIVAGILGWAWYTHVPQAYVPRTKRIPVEATSTLPATTGTPAPKTQEYTFAEVATHNSAESCWTTVSGSVYDLTSWITQHPGGEGAILSICGVDGTAAFAAQHGESQRAQDTLKTFRIGSLAQ